MATAEQVGNVVPKQLDLTPKESDAVLEIAYLAIAADRVLNEEEVAAFKQVASKLRGGDGSMSEAELGTLLDRFTNRLEHTRATMEPAEDMDDVDDERKRLLRAEADERLLALTADLPRMETRELAYKLAYALALCDLETTDDEFEFDLQLVDALGINSDRAGELADDVVMQFNT
ncbi:MAG: hypothetical protein ABI183_20645 [Polyangiaceae bacterium]